jgi:hypothetical protein
MKKKRGDAQAFARHTPSRLTSLTRRDASVVNCINSVIDNIAGVVGKWIADEHNDTMSDNRISLFSVFMKEAKLSFT